MSEGTPGSWPDEEGESLTVPGGDAVSAAEGLTGALGQMRDELRAMRAELKAAREASEERDEKLRRDARRLRGIVIGLVISLIFDVTVTVLVSAIVAQQHSATVAACRIGNQYRAAQIVTWTHLTTVASPPPHETAAQRRQREKTITAFLAYIRRENAPRNCGAAYRLP